MGPSLRRRLCAALLGADGWRDFRADYAGPSAAGREGLKVALRTGYDAALQQASVDVMLGPQPVVEAALCGVLCGVTAAARRAPPAPPQGPGRRRSVKKEQRWKSET